MKRKYPKYDGYGAIYKLTSPSGKFYIGQTITELSKRIASHIREAKRGSECRIHLAIAKYGINSFQIEIIAVAKSYEELNELELKFIMDLNALDPKVGYNISLGPSQHPDVRKKVANARRGYKHKEETKLKQKEAAKKRWEDPDARKEHSVNCKHEFTEQHKQKMRHPKSTTEKMKKPKSEAHKKALSESKKAFYKKKKELLQSDS